VGITGLTNEKGWEFAIYKVAQASVSEEDYDTFLSNQVNELISPKSGEAPFEPDLVVLPHTLSEINPAELTGIRLAAHFRLDDRDGCLKKAPMLILGPFSLDEAFRLSPLARFLVTPQVFMSDLSTADALLNWIEINKDNLHPLSEKEYSSFMDGFVVDAPSNDSHHSVTNRWTLLRWEEMFEWESNPPQLHPSVRDFANGLYFKWLQATLGPRTHFKKKHKAPAQISNISGKIVFIDDEVGLGWGDIMERLIGNSKAKYLAYEDFDSTYSREELFTRIKSFIDSVPDASCYVLDLRLHEEDHTNPDHTAYTGHRIAQYIYDEKNQGAQIVFFTASEKTLNYVASEKYFSGYVIKENPAHLYDRDGSKMVFSCFAHAIQKACANSYLRDYYCLCKDIPYLQDFFEILRQDDDTDTRSHEINMRSAALNLIVFIETAIKTHFIIDGIRLRKGSEAVDIFDACIELDLSTTPKTPIQFGSYPDRMPANDVGKEWSRIAQKGTDIGLICAALHGYCGVGRDHINKVIELKNIRNSSLAHGGGSTDTKSKKIDILFLRSVFDNVVKKMISKQILTR
jgi:hypothetical protein